MTFRMDELMVAVLPSGDPYAEAADCTPCTKCTARTAPPSPCPITDPLTGGGCIVCAETCTNDSNCDNTVQTEIATKSWREQQYSLLSSQLEAAMVR